jgi:hypothetical protein
MPHAYSQSTNLRRRSRQTCEERECDPSPLAVLGISRFLEGLVIKAGLLLQLLCLHTVSLVVSLALAIIELIQAAADTAPPRQAHISTRAKVSVCSEVSETFARF